MEKALVKKSDLLKIKYKFFINRLLTYFSFLCIPLLIQETLKMNLLVQSIILIIYMLFMGGQWYLLGKEIDHRLKIYYRANSTVERVVYRLIIGSVIMLLLFNVFSLFPSSVHGYIFWSFFGSLGIFYSWPTRGKIIEETMMGQFGEMKYLDSFEKTIFVLSVTTFIISLPELPLFQNIEALKLYFDPELKVSPMFWNFLSFTYRPFAEYSMLYNLIWSFHFYFIGLGIFLMAFYSLLRYFFSRRLGMLGVFSVISTWSFSRILAEDYFSCISTTAPVIWVWSMMWSSRSGTYRAGLFTGLVAAYLTMINPLNFILLPIGIILSYFLFLEGKTAWFKRQWLKYNMMGALIALPVFYIGIQNIDPSFGNTWMLWNKISDHIYRKAFFIISPIGLLLLIMYITKSSRFFLSYVSFDLNKIKEVCLGILFVLSIGVLFNPDFLSGFSLVWVLSFFALIPIEWIFQSISRLRSKRNLIYAMYILVCLLDSHLENRFRIIGKLFLEIESFKYFIEL